MIYFGRYILPVVMQITTMTTDLFLLCIIAAMYQLWGVIGLIVAVLLIWPGVQKTGGAFYSWRPSSIKAFFAEWKKIVER